MRIGMEFRAKKAVAVFALWFGVLSAGPEANAESAFGYKLETDVVYGTGIVGGNDKPVERDLMLDVYSPSEKSDTALPAVILVHGGAFHRGGRRQPPFREQGAVHSRMEDYARLLTPLGYVCFVVEYRLTPELPEPRMALDADWLQPMDEAVTEAGIARTNLARAAMDLPPLRRDQMDVSWKGMLSAAEDVESVVKFVRASAEKYNIDPDRIALGGHSAGATTVLNAGFGLRAPVAAMFPLSPAISGLDITKTITSPDLPPVLYVVSQNDDPVILEGAPVFVNQMKTAGIDYEFVWVPGFPHFYPSGAVSLSDDGTRMSLGERIVEFLAEHLK